MRLALVIIALGALVTAATARVSETAPVNQAAIAAERAPALLSDYHFFTDAGAREPNARVTPYDLNTALWSDGALKFRYVFVPPGARALYRDDGVFEFPLGTVLIKTFAFAADMRQPTENLRYLETRLLIRNEAGWEARAYVWNEAQTAARLSPAGADIPVSFTDAEGQAVALDWAVPNRNQCKGCHDRAGEFTPIGPTARNLNRRPRLNFTAEQLADVDFDPAAPPNQLQSWLRLGILDQAPYNAPRVPDAYGDGALAARARAYLDVNCAHCHNPQGPAHTSGLDLRWSQGDSALWGVFKRPVAAGRASGGFDYAIEPGHPERSFLLHRMESTDPGTMMPELGRQLVDERAAALIRDWIAGMDSEGRSGE